MSSVDVLCLARAYVDMTFTGLRHLPRAGREEFAAGLLRTPGGGAVNAIGAARLGLTTACAFPVGDDEPGDFLRAQLASDGVCVRGAAQGPTPITVVLPCDGDRACVTYDPEAPFDLGSLATLRPERVIYTLDQIQEPPQTARAFVTIGDREASRYATRRLPVLPPVATVLVNADEALLLSGRSNVKDAARVLAEWAEVVVVTLGAEGALACTGDVLCEAPGIAVSAVDTTGAGDLLAAAWVWGDARELDLELRLLWAVLYAGLSVTRLTAAAGAVHLDALLREGSRRGLPAPCSPSVAGSRT